MSITVIYKKHQNGLMFQAIYIETPAFGRSKTHLVQCNRTTQNKQ